MFKLLVLLAAMFAAAALAWMLFLPVVLTTQLRARTGFDAEVESLSVNPFTGDVELRGFVLTNPPTFPEKEFLRVRELRANADVWSLFSGPPVFNTMTVDVAKVTLVKNREGATNAEVLQRHLPPRAEGPLPPAPTANAGAKAAARVKGGAQAEKSFLVRKLALKFDQLVIADHTGLTPRVQDFRLGIDQHYLDVTELSQLFDPSVLKHLAPVAAAAAGLLPGDWGQVVGEAAQSGTALLKDVGRKAEVRVKGFLDALEESKKP